MKPLERGLRRGPPSRPFRPLRRDRPASVAFGRLRRDRPAFVAFGRLRRDRPAFVVFGRLRRGKHRRWLIVVVFAVAMAWLEAATVYYLRAMVDRIEPYQENPLPIRGILGEVELVREIATLVMLLTIGMLAGRTWHKRLGYTAIAFGVWDIFYYVFLRMICDWPKSLFAWDILFLLPLPWWGPVLAPVAIASLMIVWGTFATQFVDHGPASSLTRPLWWVSAFGIALALSVFMADALRTIPQGLDVTRQVLPRAFNWSMFCVALTLMAVPVAHKGWQLISRFEWVRLGSARNLEEPRRTQ